ncbi:MAG: cupin domain-containing protein [Saprospiraceae bacterium]
MKSKDPAEDELKLANELIGKPLNPKLKSNIMDVLNNFSLEEHFDLTNPPLINKYSSLDAWLKGTAHISLPQNAENIFLLPIREKDKIVQFVGYVRDTIPDEDHDDMTESFFILEGTCTLMINHEAHRFAAGDYFELPLNTVHSVKVTSDQPLKAVLQRNMI